MHTPKKVLYADDDQDDKGWIVEAWQAEPYPLELEFVDDGRKALEYLAAADGNLPALIVLDLNMPGLDGRQTLQRLKADERFAAIPVAIVTTSTSRLDREVCRRLGADLFLTKADSPAAWREVVKKLLGQAQAESGRGNGA